MSLHNTSIYSYQSSILLLILSTGEVDVSLADKVTDGAALRIFDRDADRTVMNERYKVSYKQALRIGYYETQDYSQGGGYITAFLSLFLPVDQLAQVRAD